MSSGGSCSIKPPRCSRCNAPASYTPSWAPRLSLCRIHYIDAFRRRVETRFRTAVRRAGVRLRRVAVAVSGGKDSVALLDVMVWLSERLGFEVVGVTIDLGIPGYSKHLVEHAVRAYEALGVEYVVLDAHEMLGFDTRCAHEAWKERRINRPTCSSCGLIKRRLLEEAVKLLDADAIATGHTISDVIGFNLANLASGVRRTFAVIEKGVYLRLKPLITVSEKDTLQYVIARGLPFTTTPCPYKPTEERPTRLAAMLLAELHPGVSRILTEVKDFESLKPVPSRCIYCGAPSEGSVCATCKLSTAITPCPPSQG